MLPDEERAAFLFTVPLIAECISVIKTMLIITEL
jgi:hypothetical protein